MKRTLGADEAVLILNVGGVKFQTYKSTLTKFPSTLLGSMFSRNESLAKANASGEYFFDRDPKAFACILNWYRTGLLVRAPDVSEILLNEEAAFFAIDAQVVEENSRGDIRDMIGLMRAASKGGHFLGSVVDFSSDDAEDEDEDDDPEIKKNNEIRKDHFRQLDLAYKELCLCTSSAPLCTGWIQPAEMPLLGIKRDIIHEENVAQKHIKSEDNTSPNNTVDNFEFYPLSEFLFSPEGIHKLKAMCREVQPPNYRHPTVNLARDKWRLTSHQGWFANIEAQLKRYLFNADQTPLMFEPEELLINEPCGSSESRSGLSIGSPWDWWLVLCLPSRFEGGEIDKGTLRTSWATHSADRTKIQWAAFTIGGHVQAVTAGCRVLMTFKVTQSATEPKTLPLPLASIPQHCELASFTFRFQDLVDAVKRVEGSSVDESDSIYSFPVGMLLTSEYSSSHTTVSQLQGEIDPILVQELSKHWHVTLMPVLYRTFYNRRHNQYEGPLEEPHDEEDGASVLSFRPCDIACFRECGGESRPNLPPQPFTSSISFLPSHSKGLQVFEHNQPADLDGRYHTPGFKETLTFHMAVILSLKNQQNCQNSDSSSS